MIVTDGRNHLELTDRALRHHRHRPAAADRELRAPRSSRRCEYYEAGRDHLNPGGIMMQWVPYGATVDEFKDHLRTFARGLPARHSSSTGAGGYGFYMLGSDEPIAFDDAAIDEVLARPGVLEDISSAYDSPAVDGRRLARTDPQPRLDRRRRGRDVHRRRPADHRRPAAARVLPAPATFGPPRHG